MSKDNKNGFSFKSLAFAIDDELKQRKFDAFKVDAFHQDGERVINVCFERESDREKFDLEGYLENHAMDNLPLDEYRLYNFYRDGYCISSVRFEGSEE